MKKILKRIIASVLIIVMMITAIPFTGIDAKAAGVSGYNAVAAAEWAKAHVYDTWSCLYGQGYWEPGTGDCANFVSQCIYMGGIDQTDRWNHTGYKAHYSQNSDGSWIRASQLYDYVVSIGGVAIRNPDASQIEVGDLIFYKKNPGTSGFSHCSIVIDVRGGNITVAAHTTNEVCYTDTNWHLGFSNEGTHLVKMYGSKCTDKVIRDFDVYTAGSDANVYSEPSAASTRQFYFYSGEYVHVYETKTVNGVTWGYTCGYGAKFAYGWVKLSTLNYKCHVKTGPVSHIMGDWYVKIQPTCSTVGVEERECSRCGYKEQRNMSVGGNHKNIVPADCLNPSYCTACGATVSSAYGHNWSGWGYSVEPTCLNGGEEKRECKRCGIEEENAVAPLGHEYVPVVNFPTCVADGTSTFMCSRCGDSYIEESEWSAWTDAYNEQYFRDNQIPVSMYESRTEYRYRDKKYTTETGTSSSMTKNGWTWYNSVHSGYTDYGSTHGPVYSDPGNTETRKSWSEQYVSDYGTTRHYYYFRYATSDDTAGSNTYVAGKYTVHQQLDLTYALTNRSSTTGEDGVRGWMVYYKSSNYNDSSTGNYKTFWYQSEADVKDTSKPIYSTRWYYQDRSKTYTNYFWQWGSWSDWSATSNTETSERDVETRTVYRVRQSALGHLWDAGEVFAPTCHEDGYTKYTCMRCGTTMKENIVAAPGDLWGERYLISEEGVVPRVYRQDCVRNCGCDCGCFRTFIEECEYEVTQIVAPTCTQQGYSIYTCALHGETYVDGYVDALGHYADEQWVVTKAPTCVDAGEEMCKCIRHDENKTCGYTYTKQIDAVGHSLAETPATAPTCEKEGNTEYYQCNNCNKYFADSTAVTEIEENEWIVSATGHKGEVWVTELASSCGVTGRECLYCENDRCDYTSPCGNHTSHNYLIDEREIKEIAPDYMIVEHKDSTCTELGYDIWSCINCHTTEKEHGWTDIINYKPHAWSEPTVVHATCTQGGTETIICSYCNKEETYGTGTATGHALTPSDDGYENSNDKMELISSVVNVCGSGSVDTYQCTHIDDNTSMRCTYKVIIGQPNDHITGDYIVTLQPSCTEEGYKHKECINEGCQYRTEDEIIPSTGHDWTINETIAPLCETQGYDHYICNNDSSHNYNDYNKAMLGHEPDGNWIVTKEPDCSNKGTEQCDCVRHDDGVTCDTVFIRDIEIDPDAHDWGDWFVDADPNCVDKGIEKRICNINNEHIQTKETVTDPDNHDMGEWYEVTKATCTEKGLEKRDCNRCDYSEERETAIDPDNHYAETFYTVDEKADCENDGKKSHHCERCDKSLDEVVISKRNHVYDNGVETKAPTCLEDGVMTFTCTNEETNEYKACTHSYTDVIPATGHDWGDWETETPATCETDGLEKRICKNDASHVEENVLTAIGHKWDNGVINPASTCNTHGTKTYTCQNDASHTKTESVPLDENNHVGDTYLKDEKEPDCTNDGYTGDTYCSDCDKKLEDGEVIPATGHDWSEWKTVKEPTYTEMGTEKRICSKCDAEETRSIPVLTRPSDDNENIETEKTVEYDSATGEAVIKLVASSKGEKITVNSRTPLDIVLVLDQSGSMEGDLLKKLKTATDDFTNAIYQDAVNNNIDHRIAMVGFAMQNQYNFGSEYPQYLNTEILTTGGAPVKYNSLSTAKMNEVYRNALVSVNVDGTLNPILTLAKNNLEAKGATAADLGLDMACQIFAQNENDGSRKRIVVFMTDGVPTYKSDYMEETATNATTKANLLKDAYDADLYSVGVLSGSNTNKAKTFLNNIASKDENNKALYFDCADADKLVEDFQTIATQSTTVTTDFADITLIDTVSSAFTLTAVQENELRKNAIEKLGITNDDITVTRYADGTTEVKLEHINPVAISDGDDINYVIDIDFRVTANEKALIAGSYGTNTDNAGVLIGTTDVYENNFAVPGATVENAEGVIYFTVNGITYHMVRVHKGDTPEAPEFTLDGEYTFSGWDIPDEVVFDGGKLTVDATLTQKEYTVTWNTADGTMTDSYYAGDVIVVPEVGLNAKGEEFIGWDNDVPVTMPAENLELTAIYGKHEHEYSENILVKVSCGVEGKVQYVCDCGYSYTETVNALTHKWATSATSSDGTDTAYSHVYCENCGESPDKTLEYTIKGTTGWNNKVTYDLKLTDAENITVQPDGEITISLPVPHNMKNARNITIYREEADGTLTNLNGTVKNGYITFTTTHFSIYIIEAEYECVETGNHTDEDADKICDICGNEIPVEEPSENCNHYCHQKGFMNFLWKIINFLYRLFGIEAERFCECGADHW